MKMDRQDIEAVKQQLDELIACQRKLVSLRDRVAQARQALAGIETELGALLPAARRPARAPVNHRRRPRTGPRLIDAIETVLKRGHRPLTTREIIDELRKVGFGSASNASVARNLLYTSKRFRRVDRGVFVLNGQGPTAARRAVARARPAPAAPEPVRTEERALVAAAAGASAG